jgi:hypothetical protein
LRLPRRAQLKTDGVLPPIDAGHPIHDTPANPRPITRGPQIVALEQPRYISPPPPQQPQHSRRPLSYTMPRTPIRSRRRQRTGVMGMWSATADSAPTGRGMLQHHGRERVTRSNGDGPALRPVPQGCLIVVER